MCRRNPPNEAPLQIPTSMFCGLPVTDATDPTLAPIASPIRYGFGLTRSGPSAASSTGVTTRQMVSFTNSAESSPPPTTTATAPSRLAAGRFRRRNGSRCAAMSRYVTPKMKRPVVIELRIVDCGLRIGATGPGPSNPQSEIDNPQSSYLPIREQHTPAWMGLRIALVGHPEVGPADAIAAGYEPAERVVEACLASHGHPPDAGAGRGGFGRRDRGIEAGRVAGGELEHAHLVLRPTLGERRRVPQDQRVQSVVAVDERRVAEAELRGQQDLASEVVARSEGRDEVARRLERQAARRALALRQQHRALMPARDDVVGQGHCEVAGEEAEPRVEPDVLHGPGHGLETQGRHVLLEQPVERRPHDGLPHPRALTVGPHGE